MQSRRAVLGQVSDMDLRLLQVFRTVVDCGGMTAAELELNIGASTISRHVKDLETRLGMVLCRRGRAGFALTPEGQHVYDETQRLLSAVDGFRHRIADLHAHMGGTLQVAAFEKTASNPRSRLALALGRFAAQAPDVHIRLHVASIQAIERGVLDGSFDAGVIPVHRASRALRYEPLFDETMLLYCGQEHPLFGREQAVRHAAAQLDWKSLRNWPFAGLGFHSPNMAMAHRRDLRRAATGLDQEAVATLVLSGHFLGFLPDHYAEPFVSQGRLRALRPTLLNYRCEYVSVMRRAPQPSRAARAFHALLVAAHR